MVGARPGGAGAVMSSAGVAIQMRGRAATPDDRARGRPRLRAALRLFIWMALWGTVLRNIGSSVGAWAAGSWGVGTTILIGVVIPAWLFVLFPGWLAFRVAPPRRMRRLAAAACWMSPLARLRDLPSIAAFFDVAADLPCPGWGELPADAWTALAAAVQADRRRSLTQAARIVDALEHLPAGARFPWLARVHAVETLVLSAVARRDWTAAARYARIGQGRLVRLLALIARGHGGEAVPASQLWTAWFLAPMRGATYPLVRAALRLQAHTPIAVTASPSPATVHARHVALLDAAARNEEIHAADVLALALAWQAEIDDAALARLRARALELGVRDGEARALAVRERVLDELALLLARAEGELPRAGLQEALAGRARERQIASIKAAFAPIAAIDFDRAGAALHPLEAWERWLALRAAWERAERSAGRAALATLWRASVRDGLWSYCCAVSHQHGARAAWAVLVMFDWMADRAEYLGDLVAVLANRENARLALASAR
jgi:hypothetical protein